MESGIPYSGPILKVQSQSLKNFMYLQIKDNRLFKYFGAVKPKMMENVQTSTRVVTFEKSVLLLTDVILKF